MFVLHVKLNDDAEYDLHGLPALDKRRELGLSDATSLVTKDTSRSCDVPEWFARTFPRKYARQDYATAWVTLADLISCDVKQDESGKIIWLADDSPARLMELAAKAWNRE